MNTEEKRYVLFDFNELSEVEKDIILVLGDDLNNPQVNCGFHPIMKGMHKTRDILNEYDLYILFENLSLLCLKDIIGITRNSSVSEDKREDWMKNITLKSFKDFILIIIERLRSNQVLLKNSEKTLIVETKCLAEEIDFELIQAELNKIKDRTTEYKISDIKSLCDEYIEGITSYSKKEVDPSMAALIESARLLIQVYQEESVVDILKNIVVKYFDKEKVLGCRYTFLTNHNNGINGVQVYNYIDRMNVIMLINDKIEKNEKLENKIEEDLKESKKIQDEMKKSQLKSIQVLTIFIAIITIIIGNVSFLPQISENSLLGAVSLVFIINGALITGVSTLVLVLAHVLNIYSSNKGSKLKWKTALIVVCAGLLVIGIALSVVDTFCVRKEEVKQVTEENTISNDTILVMPQKIEGSISSEVSDSADVVEEENEPEATDTPE